MACMLATTHTAQAGEMGDDNARGCVIKYSDGRPDLPVECKNGVQYSIELPPGVKARLVFTTENNYDVEASFSCNIVTPVDINVGFDVTRLVGCTLKAKFIYLSATRQADKTFVARHAYFTRTNGVLSVSTETTQAALNTWLTAMLVAPLPAQDGEPPLPLTDTADRQVKAKKYFTIN